MSFLSFSQEISKIDSIVKSEMKSENIPAIGLGIIKNGELKYLRAYGYSDIENKTIATINTPFQVASISKTIINLCIFKLVQQNKIDLNANINNYLNFSIENPFLPNKKITIKELLNHQSGLIDNYAILDIDNIDTNGDSDIKLSEYMKSYFSNKGALYNKNNFQNSKQYRYSNVGYALLGLIIENVSAKTLEKFSQKNIFKPLGMKNTNWFLKNLNTKLVSKTYTKGKNGNLKFLGFNGYPIYPSGQLRTSIKDYTTLILKYLNSSNDNFILNSKMTTKITPEPSFSRKGWFTWNKVAIGNTLYYAHEGADTGVKTLVIMDVVNNNSIIIFINSETKLGKILMSLIDEVME